MKSELVVLESNYYVRQFVSHRAVHCSADKLATVYTLTQQLFFCFQQKEMFWTVSCCLSITIVNALVQYHVSTCVQTTAEIDSRAVKLMLCSSDRRLCDRLRGSVLLVHIANNCVSANISINCSYNM